MPKQFRTIVALLPLLVAASACRFEGTIDAKGGAEVTVHYRIDPKTQLDKVAADLQSKDVKVVKKSIDQEHYVDATLQTANVTKLSTVKFFQGAAITLSDGPEKGTKILSIHYVNSRPSDKYPQAAIKYFGDQVIVVLHLPGDVVKSNATEVKGSSATWTLETTKLFAAKETLFEVTYKLGK